MVPKYMRHLKWGPNISSHQKKPDITDYYAMIDYFPNGICLFGSPTLKDTSICYCAICDVGVRFGNIEKHLSTSRHRKMDYCRSAGFPIPRELPRKCECPF